MIKIDHKKEYKEWFTASATQPKLVDLPPLDYLMIDGHGDPNTAPAYQQAIEAMYAIAYGLKFRVKKGEAGVDFTVMPLEGLWWVPDMNLFSKSRKDDWDWTMLILQPPVVTAELFQTVLAETRRKKPLPALDRIRFESYHEGRSAQILYFGPYSAEGPTIQKLHAFIASQGYALRGKHHEIYFSDPRRTAPEKLRTIIRQPLD